MRRYGIRDDQWERIRDLLPGQEGHVGVTAADNRLFVEAVLYRYRTGMPWRDLPERFGDWKNVHQRSTWANHSHFKLLPQPPRSHAPASGSSRVPEIRMGTSVPAPSFLK